MLKTPANFVLDSQEFLNVPHTRKELPWQLGEGGWKLNACGSFSPAALLAAVLSIRKRNFHLQ